MAFCQNCGQEINDNADVCVHCGVRVAKSGANDAKSTGFAVLGFFFPVVGLILYLVWKNDFPLKAHSAGKGALIGVIVYFVVSIIYGIILGSVIANTYVFAIPAVIV